VRHPLRGALIALPCAGLIWLAACVSLDNPNQGGTCTRLGTIAVGDTLDDTVSSASCRLSDGTYVEFYTVAVDSQAKLAVNLRSHAQPAFLWLTDSTSAFVAITTFTQSPDTAATMALLLQPGNYRLAVNSYNTSPSGAFRVIVARDTTAVRGCYPVWVTHGITTSQTITGADCNLGPLGTSYLYHLYLHMIQSGEELKLTEHSTGFSPQVLVVSQTTGLTVATSALDTTGTNAQVDLQPSSPDALRLWVGSSDTHQLGSYTLTIP
jgi:hypothetical protein